MTEKRTPCAACYAKKAKIVKNARWMARCMAGGCNEDPYMVIALDHEDAGPDITTVCMKHWYQVVSAFDGLEPHSKKCKRGGSNGR